MPLFADLRTAIRTFAAAPGILVAAVVSLALGIGANSAIFSVASALLLRPLPYRDADRLAILWNRSPGLGITEDWFSTAQYFDVKTRNRAFEHVAVALGANFNLTGDGPPERIGTIRVSSNLLPMLGVTPAMGRLFEPAEDAQSPSTAAILSHGTWMRRYGGAADVIGRPIVLNGQTSRIVGVLPAPFSLRKEVMPTLGVVADAEVLLPLPLGPDAPNIRGREDYNLLARLRPDVTVEQAQADMDALTSRLRAEHPGVYPPNGGLTFSVVPLRDQVVGDVRRGLVVLIAAVGGVLLIACANVANLLLSRALAREREIAIRAALGASRGRILRLLLTESVLLAIAGGALGLLFAVWSLDGIRALGAGSVPRLGEIAIDVPVLVFTLVVSCLAGLLFGSVPALRLGAVDVHSTLKSTGRTAAGPGAVWGRGRNLRRTLVVSELALSVTLLIGAGLLLRSFARVQDVPPGFDGDRVLTMEMTLTGPRYGDAAAVAEAYRQLWERVAGITGVEVAGGVSALPLSEMMSWGPITVEGRIPPPGEQFINVDQRIVGGRYFDTMRIPLRRGRLFTDRDVRTQPRVAVADELMAQQLWPGLDPVGRRIRLGGADSTTPWVTIVGVVGRVKQDRLDADSRMAMYIPHAQFPTRAMNVVLRSASADPASFALPAANAIRRGDPDLPVYNIRTMGDRVDESLARRRFSTLLMTLFAVLALGLAAIGIYSVVAYTVSQGAREIGIRMALGASPARILLLVVRHGAAMAGLGIAIGVAAATALAPMLRSMLFGVASFDPATFGTIAGLLALVALVACAVPAVRASRIDPIASLRAE